MKKFFFAILCLCISQIAVTQTRIVGRVINAEDKSSIPSVQVALFSVKDTSLITGATTSIDGNFAIEKVNRGQYILRAIFVGYTTFEQKIDVADMSKPLNMGDIALIQGIQLKEFEIKETYVPVQIKEDTIEFNAEAFRPVEGSALEELLKRMPGVEVDSDGKITIKGKEVSQILVDGEKFFSDDPKVASKNIPADYVDKVQTYEKKSDQAQFTGIDDGNEETVINLSFKPGMKKGWFGRFTAGGGADLQNGDFRYDNTFNINYFKDKDQMTILGGFNNVNNLGFTDFSGANVVMMGGGRRRGGFSFRPGGGITQSLSPGINFVKKFNDRLSLGGSYTYSRSDRNFEQSTYRENILPTGSEFYEETKTVNMLQNQHRFNGELEYKPNENNELRIRPSLSYSNSENYAFSQYNTKNSLMDTLNEGTIDNESESYSFSARVRTDFRHRFAKPRRTFSIELDAGYSLENSDDFNTSFSNYFDGTPNDSVNQNVRNDGTRYNWSTQLAYTEPLIRDFTLELRYTFSNSEDNTEKLAYDFDGQEYSRKDTTYSNLYGNLFYNQRFEIRVQKSTEKYRYSFGLGMFPSNTLSRLDGRDDITLNTLNFAPQAQFNYNFSKQSGLRFRYYGRTNQPSVSQMQPVPDNSDPLNIRVGNARLKPEFNHGLRAMYNNYFPNFSSIFTALSVSMTQNSIMNQTYTHYDANNEMLDSSMFRPGVRVVMANNVDFVYNTNAMLAYSTPILSDKITLSSTSNGGYSQSSSLTDNQENILKNLSLFENLRVTYRLETFDVSLNGRIRWNDVKYSLQSNNNNQYYTTSGGLDFNWQIIKNKLILSSDFSFSATHGYADDYNPRYNTWNAQLAWNIGKSNEGQLRLRVYDILNDNKNTQRTAEAGYIEDVTYNTLQRYVMLSFTYNLNTAKSKDAPQENGVGTRRRWGPPHGGRPR